MSKPPADQECMFCAPDPCQCNPRKAAAKKSRKASAPTAQITKTAQPEVVKAAFDPRAAMKAAVQETANGDLANVRKEQVPANGDIPVSEAGRDFDYDLGRLDDTDRYAIHSLGPLLDHSDRLRYAEILADPNLRARAWRARHG